MAAKKAESVDLFECAVCSMCMLDRVPRFLHCHHTFCEECLVQLKENWKIICPTCREVTYMKSNDVKELSVNFMLSQMKDAMKKINRATSNCQVCKSQKPLFLCSTCLTLLCLHCRESHIAAETQNHDILDLCEKHQEGISHICMKCKTPLCMTCMLHEHQEHKSDFVCYSEGLFQIKSELQTLSTELICAVLRVEPFLQSKKETAIKTSLLKEKLCLHSKYYQEKLHEVNQWIFLIDQDLFDYDQIRILCTESKQICAEAYKELELSVVAGTEIYNRYHGIKEKACNAIESIKSVLNRKLNMPPFVSSVTVPSSDLLEQKTGEENTTVMFTEMAQLYRYNKASKQWKWQGDGKLKLLQDNSTSRYRVLMRIDFVQKLCANHWITENMELVPMKASTGSYSYKWLAADFSKQAVVRGYLCVKFDLEITAKKFESVFNECIQETKRKDSKAGIVAKQTIDMKRLTTSNIPAASSQPETEKPSSGMLALGSDRTFTFQAATHITRPKTPFSGKSHLSPKSAEYYKSHNHPYVYFKPVVTLPDKVEVRTGEEEEELLFSERAKLYRYIDGEWKERGLGTMKILKHKSRKLTRLLMRREKVLKVCCNHVISKDFELHPVMSMRDKAWIWHAEDFSEPESQHEQFSVKFRTEEQAKTFKSVIDNVKEEKFGKRVKPTSAEFNLTQGGAFKFGERSFPNYVPDYSSSQESKAKSLSFSTSTSTSNMTGSFKLKTSVSTTEGEEVAEVASSLSTKTAKWQVPSFKFSNVGVDLFTFSAKKTETQNGPAYVKVFGQKDFPGTRRSLFGVATKQEEEDKNDVSKDGGEEYEPKVDFKPIVPLPDLVEQKTGEENTTKMFGERAKLFRRDPGSKQWKERGIGELKILQDNTSGRYRIVMRRDQVLKLCANHWITVNMELTPMTASSNSYMWLAADFSEDEVTHEHFAAKFKLEERAEDFKSIFDEGVKETQEQESKTKAVTEDKEKVAEKPSLEKFKPKAGSWECSACYISNDESCVKCVACDTTKPGTTVLKSADSTTSGSQSATDKALAEKFKPSAGSWECGSCYISNGADRITCVACETPKPGCEAEAKAQKEKEQQKSAQSASQFKFGAGGYGTGQFQFGKPSEPSKPTTSGGFSLIQGGGFKFGASSATGSVQPDSNISKESETDPFLFGISTKKPEESGGFKFGASASATEKKEVSSSVNKETPKKEFTFKFSSEAVDLSTPKKTDSQPQPKAKATLSFAFGSDKTFTFQAVTPTTKPKTPTTVKSPLSPQSPEYYKSDDEPDVYFEPVVPLPEKVQVKTGEEEEEVLFSERAKLYRYVDSEWKERGLGVMKILKHQSRKSARLLMRREQVLKVCCNHVISKDFELLPMSSIPDKAWIWHAEDFSEKESQHEQFAIKFKTEEQAKTFKSVIDNVKGGQSDGKPIVTELPHDTPIVMSPKAKSDPKKFDFKPSGTSILGALASTPKTTGIFSQPAKSFQFSFGTPTSQKTPVDKVDKKVVDKVDKKASGDNKGTSLLARLLSGGDSDSDDDVCFIKESQPTEAQIQKAREFLLPDNFYLYTEKKPCKGCRGCDENFDFSLIGKTPVKEGKNKTV